MTDAPNPDPQPAPYVAPPEDPNNLLARVEALEQYKAQVTAAFRLLQLLFVTGQPLTPEEWLTGTETREQAEGNV